MSDQEKHCLHCGTPVPPKVADQRFCCAGCEYVYDMLHEQGLDKFYDLRGAQALSPVAPQSLRERDYEWLTGLVTEAEATCEPCKPAQLQLAVQGLSCVGCVWLIEKVFQQSKGAVRIEIHAPRGELYLEWMRGVFDAIEFAKQLQRFGYLVGRVNEKVEGSNLSPITRRMGLCGAFAMNAMAFSLPAYMGMSPKFMFASWFDIIAAASATLALIVGGSYFAERSYRALRHGVLHIDTPITLGIGVAWIGSMIGWASGEAGLKYFDFVAIFIFLMLAGRLLQQAAVERNRRRLLQSASVPDTLHRLGEDGNREEIALAEIRVGDTLILKQGEVCPVTSHLHTGSASLSLEWINGESEAAQRTEGQAVPSGALNIGSGAIEVVAQESWKDSLLQRLLKGKEATHDVSPFVAGLLRWYLAVVVLIGFGGGAAWLATGHGLAKSLQVMISVFVVSCPCALGVAAPFADDLAAAWMQRLGVFVRSNFLWQRLARVRKIVFDKTGTLTLENPVLKNPGALDSLNSEQRSALRVLVGSNLHPVSRSLFDALGPVKDELKAEDGAVEEVIGQGLRFTDSAGAIYALGRPGWRGGDLSTAAVDADTEFTLNGRLLAAFSFEDALRPETLAAFDLLRSKRMELHLLSGDRKEKVALTAEVLGIKNGCWKAEMTPDEKAQWVAGLNNQDTLYIGDGANDSLALEAALCAGSPVTGRNFLEHKADFYFLGNSLRFVPALLAVAIRRRTAVRCVFGFALLYNLCAVMLSLAGHMSPLLAAILMPLSSIVTLGIARLVFGRQEALAAFSSTSLVLRKRWHRPDNSCMANSMQFPYDSDVNQTKTMKKFHHIIVGIDFSPGSRSALAAAVRLAAKDEAQVTAVHVIDPALAGNLKTAHGFTDKQLFDSVAGRVRHFMDQSDVGADRVDIDLDVGNAFIAVVDACHRHKADLIVLGSRGSEHAHNQIGAVAAKCIRKAPTDVLLVRTGANAPFKQILTCVDFSETSAKAVREARHVAEIEGSKMECLYVHQSPMALAVDDGGFVPPLPEAVNGEDGGAWEKELDDFLSPLLRTAENLEWKPVIVERVGIRDAIYDQAKESKTDLVVLGTRGKTDLRTLVFGTTAEKIISHAPCSILAVKPEGFDYPLDKVPSNEPAQAPLA